MDYNDPTVTTTAPSTANAGMSMTVVGFDLVLAVVALASLWRIFQKAGRPGWAAIIPIYNTYVLLQIVGRPAWWLILCLIPLVNFVIAVILAIDLAKAFGKSTVFGVVGLFLFSIVGFPMLAFGSAQYKGPQADAVPATPATPAAPTPPAAS